MGNLSVWNLDPNEFVAGYKFLKLREKSDYWAAYFSQNKDSRHLILSAKKNIFLNHKTKQISPPKISKNKILH